MGENRSLLQMNARGLIIRMAMISQFASLYLILAFINSDMYRPPNFSIRQSSVILISVPATRLLSLADSSTMKVSSRTFPQLDLVALLKCHSNQLNRILVLSRKVFL